MAAGSIPVGLPFDGEALLAYLALRAIAGVERVGAGRYTRALTLGDDVAVVEIDVAAAGKTGEARFVTDAGADRLPELEQLVDRLLDASWSPGAAAEVLGADPALGALVRRRPGLRIPGTMAPFEIAVRAIVGQQISVAGATTLTARLVARWGTPLQTGRGGLTHLFPSPAVLAGAPIEEIGMPSSRAEAIRRMSAAVAAERLRLDAGCEDGVAALLHIRGIGPWTASYVALRGLGLRDAIPASDLGLRQALGRDGEVLSAAAVEERAEHWRPFRGVAAAHLWTRLILD